MDEGREFVERVIEINKDMGKALSIFNHAQQVQHEINRQVAQHIDDQNNRIKAQTNILTAMNIISVLEFVLIGWLLVVVL